MSKPHLNGPSPKITSYHQTNVIVSIASSRCVALFTKFVKHFCALTERKISSTGNISCIVSVKLGLTKTVAN